MLLALALAARAIVVLIGRLFNRLALDVGISPCVELQPIKADALLPDRKLANVRPDRLVEFIPAHAEVAIGFAGANEAREDGRDLGRASIGHRDSSPGVHRQAYGLIGTTYKRGDCYEWGVSTPNVCHWGSIDDLRVRHWCERPAEGRHHQLHSTRLINPRTRLYVDRLDAAE